MVWGTNEGLASHIKENPNEIQSKKHNWKHIKNSLNASL